MIRYNSWHILISVLVLSVIFQGRSYASYFGIETYYGAGNFDLASKPYLLAEVQASGTINKAGAGVLFGSDFYGNSIYNVKCDFVIDRSSLSSDSFTGSESLISFNFGTVLCFNLVTKNPARLWIGPELRMGIVDGKGSDFTKDVSANTFSIGIQGGSDINLHGGYALSVIAGARYDRYRDSSMNMNTSLKGHAAYVYIMAAFLINFSGS